MAHNFKYFKDGLMAEGWAGSRGLLDNNTDKSYKAIEPSAGAVVVLAPKLIMKPIEPSPDEMFQTTIVDSQIAQPTARLMGEQFNGGYGTPWSTGPGSLPALHVPIGSMLFYIGNAVAVSLGIGGESDLFSQALVNYHRRGVFVKIHTGIGMARGGASRNERPGGGGTPYNSPNPPGGGLAPVVPDWAAPSQGPTIDVPGIGRIPLAPEEHGEGMHQHPGSSFIDRWKEDFGSLWDGFAEIGPWVFGN